MKIKYKINLLLPSQRGLPMRVKTNTLLYCIIVFMLIYTFPLIMQRYINESNNKSIAITANLYDFMNLSISSELSLDDVFMMLNKSGVKAVSVDFVLNYKDNDITSFSHAPEDTLQKLNKEGFDIILNLSFRNNTVANSKDNNPLLLISDVDVYSPNECIEYMNNLLTKYSIKYITFENGIVPNSPNIIEVLSNIIKSGNLITGLTEAPTQDGYIKSPGLEMLIKKTDFYVNRLYKLSEKDLTQLSSVDLFYRWIRCASDRNIRIFEVKPLQNPERTVQQNFEETCKAIRKFTGYINTKGFNTNADLKILPDNFHTKVQDCALLINVACAFLICINIFGTFIKKCNIIVCSYLMVLSATSIIMILYLNGILSSDELCRIIALTAAIIYPSIAVQSLSEINNINFSCYIYKLVFSLSALISNIIIGCITISSALSDITFMMNINTFPGVPAAYIIPIVLFVLNYCMVNNIHFRDITYLAESKKHFKLKAIFILLVSSLLFTVYITRTGNNPVIPASRIEISIRKLLEYHLFARPRFKEFLIGYPAIFVYIYFFKKNNKHSLLIPLGIMVTIGSITTINSFCHVFTPIHISVLRSFNGLILGIITGTLAIGLVKIGEKICNTLCCK